MQLRVDESLQRALEDLRRKIATSIKKKFGLEEITVYGTLTSKILVAKMQGRKNIPFRIKKNGLNKGILELTDHTSFLFPIWKGLK